MELIVKTSLKIVFVGTYRCCYILIVNWIFCMCIKFHEDVFPWVFNFAIFLQLQKTENLRPAKLSFISFQ